MPCVASTDGHYNTALSNTLDKLQRSACHQHTHSCMSRNRPHQWRKASLVHINALGALQVACALYIHAHMAQRAGRTVFHIGATGCRCSNSRQVFQRIGHRILLVIFSKKKILGLFRLADACLSKNGLKRLPYYFGCQGDMIAVQK